MIKINQYNNLDLDKNELERHMNKIYIYQIYCIYRRNFTEYTSSTSMKRKLANCSRVNALENLKGWQKLNLIGLLDKKEVKDGLGKAKMSS